MVSRRRGDILDDFARKCIQRNVRNLSRNFGYTISDQEDLEQDVLVHLYQRIEKFDPSRGSWQNFVISVVTSKVRNLIEERHARKRDFNRTGYSIDELVSDGMGGFLHKHEMIGQLEHCASGADMTGYSAEQIWLKVDIDRIGVELPEELLDVWEMLKYCGFGDAAKALDTSRKSVHRRARRIRKILQAHEIDAYL